MLQWGHTFMVQNQDKKERAVKKQTVAGFIIFRRTEEGVKYLLLYRRGEYWNFPKGHFEEGEQSLDTALREAEEETGLRKNELHILPGFRAYEKFHFYSAAEKIYDTVILYLAETKQPRILISPREHSGYAWFLYADAMKILRRYAGTRRVLKQVNEFIRRQGYRPLRQEHREVGHPPFVKTATNQRQKPDNRPPGNKYAQPHRSFFTQSPRSGERNSFRPNTQLPRSGQTRRPTESAPSRRQYPPFLRRPAN
jgi:8-oxo-dGTP pyrophosphatase MutT (NUDIX family)